MSLKKDINKLECHFKWHPNDIDVDGDLDKQILKKSYIIDEYDDLRPFKLNFIGYLYTRVSPPNYTEALKFFKTALKESDEPTDEGKGHLYIATANQIHTLHLIGNNQNKIAQLWKTIVQFDKLPKKAEAYVHGHRAFTFSHYGKTNYPGSVEAYKMSMELDPQNYLWPWGISFSEGRIRRIKKGTRSLGTDAEKTILRKAIKLSGEQNAFPIVMLADLQFNDARNISPPFTDPEMIIEAEILFEKAYKLSPHSAEVLKRYGKFVGIVKHDKIRQIALLKEACEINPYNPQTWFRLGQAYRYMPRPDLAKAEEYHLKAVQVGNRRHFFAELNLGVIRKKRNCTYDLIEHFEAMRIHYKSDENRQRILDEEIEKGKR